MNKERQGLGIREQGSGLVLLKKPVQRVEAAVVREGTTGRVVSVVPKPAVKGKLLMLPRVWAVAEAGGAVEVMVPPIEFPGQEEEVVAKEAAVLDDGPVFDDDEDDEDEGEAMPVELAFYRKYTEAMLRRYVRLSMAVGRVPSLLGRELFRGHVSSYRMTNFEDVVVFCFDMEKLLGRMRAADQEMIKRIGMQEYKHQEVASMMRMSLRHCRRAYGHAMDRLTELLLEARMLELLER